MITKYATYYHAFFQPRKNIKYETLNDQHLKESLEHNKKLKCLYLHGLGADVSQEIKDALSEYELIYPHINYDGTTQPYYDCLDILNKNEIDFIVGHSVGGVMAYWLAKEKNVPALLLCPAFGDEYTVYVSKQVKRCTPKMLAIIGTEDDEVDSTEIRNKLKTQENCSIVEVETDHDIEPNMLKNLVINFLSNLK